MAPQRQATRGGDESLYDKLHCASCGGLCRGDAWWPYNAICFPFVLVWNAFYHYLLACLSVFAYRFCMTVCCWPCYTCCPKTWNFVDKKFPPGPGAILDPNAAPFDDNEFYGNTPAQISAKVDWMRADDVLRDSTRRAARPGSMSASVGRPTDEQPPHFFLFEGGIRPDDIIQGQLGDCWLLSALSSMAEYPEAIRNCFVQNEYHPRHKYRVKMWDIRTKSWLHVSVDDYVPVKKGTSRPYFTDPQGRELWVFLIEKAFAKFHGGYAYLDGGRSPWAWHVLTGDNVFSFKLNQPDVWSTFLYDFEFKDSQKHQWHAAYLRDTGDRCNHDRMHEMIRQFCRHRAPMGASIHSQSRATNGLVAFHAYSLIDAVRSGKKKLVKLRNPWGRHSDLMHKCKQTKDEFDGAFWMSMEDFALHFDRIDVCDRSVNRDLRLDVREDDGACGVVKGCCFDCGRYWCLCMGIRTLYLGHRTGETLDYHKPICACRDTGRGWQDSSIV
ncbi:uncharacterized protein MONBRDRAFT_8020 [Monosiga brevicollis MX1]|uniref:Calpain catalytic domain-containing protein n=1 Tax=Monosiga brevicollis TaxID=81824 RepID=A9UYT4_MONBE|nr:uncharacterized protein MONBRDRAFT_8020 [Monosiga brevicollis MX1]EDQ89661.1 predicted protein [Monosiga brevicollis MX1]|eukprot:XP_001745690.1 hypothetical protein [Monosiga brevicollis MX1]